jgi:uncharacterized hydantoinase/oxoprolinase family protein
MARRAVLMSAALIGWDVGGAHLKAAAVSSTGELLRVWSIPCPLWQGLDQLESAVSQIEAELALAQCRHALTMTGEMCDLFTTRDAGVSGITHWFQRRLGGAPLRVYAADAGLLVCDAVDARAVASMNWHATASAVARARTAGQWDSGMAGPMCWTHSAPSTEPRAPAAARFHPRR